MRKLVLPALTAAVAAQATQAPTFAPPVRIQVAGKWLGEGRLYPSPVLHDHDRDGLPDLVIGDLRGHLTVARRQPGNAAAWAAETQVMANDGRLLDFHNW